MCSLWRSKSKKNISAKAPTIEEIRNNIENAIRDITTHSITEFEQEIISRTSLNGRLVALTAEDYEYEPVRAVQENIGGSICHGFRGFNYCFRVSDGRNIRLCIVAEKVFDPQNPDRITFNYHNWGFFWV